MAFGFTRQRGTGRGYVNDSNPDFATGQRLSRRQYDKYVETLGKRSHGADIIRETERQLETLRDQLSRRSADLDRQADALRLAELELEYERASFRMERTSAGQRRYNSALSSYVKTQRARGRRITKREAAQSPEFKSIMTDLRGQTNRSRNPNIADANRFRRRKALDRLGGDQAFRDEYELLHGGRIGGHGFRKVRRSYTARRHVA